MNMCSSSSGVLRVLPKSMDDADLDILKNAFTLKQTVRFTTVSSLALMVFDWALSSSDEINLVWSSAWSSAKAIFFLNRYMSLAYCLVYTLVISAFDASPSSCKTQMYMQAYAGWLSLAVVELLLQFWLSALYQPSRKWIIFMSTTYSALAMSSFIAISLSLSQMNVELEIPSCLLTRANLNDTLDDVAQKLSKPRPTPTLYLALVPSIVYEMCLLALLVRRAWQCHASSRPVNEKRSYHSSVSGVLVKDSVIYFVITFIVHLCNALIWTFAPSQLFSIGVGFTCALPAIFGSRLLLDLRAVYQRESACPLALSQLSAIHFGRVSATSTLSL